MNDYEVRLTNGETICVQANNYNVDANNILCFWLEEDNELTIAAMFHDWIFFNRVYK